MHDRPGLDHALLAALVVLWCAAFSAALVPLSRSVARRLGILDTPGQRKIHSIPTPRLGGTAVIGSFALTVLAGYLAIPFLPRGPGWPVLGEVVPMLAEAGRVADKLTGILVGSAIVFAVGFADDALGSRFPPAAKLMGQVLAAVVLVVQGVRTTVMPEDWMNVVLTVLWVVGITNAFNFLDNMDGLAAGVAAVACLILLCNAALKGEFFIVLLLAALLGSLLGFLRHNFHPASVFLGDCGSHFIGFMMASLTLLERYLSHASSSLFPVLMPVLVLAIPLIDTTTVVVIRLREGRPVYRGDTRHLSHRLVDLGFSTRKAVLSIYLAAFCFGLGALLLPDANVTQSVFLVVQALGFATLLILLMFHDRPPVAERTS